MPAGLCPGVQHDGAHWGRESFRQGTYRPPGQPRGEELPCRFLSGPGSSRGNILGPGAAPCEEELPCRMLSHPMTLSGTGRIQAAPDIEGTELIKHLRNSSKPLEKALA